MPKLEKYEKADETCACPTQMEEKQKTRALQTTEDCMVVVWKLQ